MSIFGHKHLGTLARHALGAIIVLAAAWSVGLSPSPASAQGVVQPTCPPGYTLQGNVCVASNPAPTCPPGFDFVNGQCLPNGQAQPAPPPPARGPSLAWELQSELKRVGCLRGRVDGIWGRGSRAALRRFNQASGLSLGTEPSQQAINAVRQTGAGYCAAVANPAPPPIR